MTNLQGRELIQVSLGEERLPTELFAVLPFAFNSCCQVRLSKVTVHGLTNMLARPCVLYDASGRCLKRRTAHNFSFYPLRLRRHPPCSILAWRSSKKGAILSAPRKQI